MRKKLQKGRKLGYIAPGKVKLLASFFAIPKEESDIEKWTEQCHVGSLVYTSNN
jgi:hypothetical protein